MRYLVLILSLFVSFIGYSQEQSYICAGGSPVTFTAGSTGGVGTVTYTWTTPLAVTTSGPTVSASIAGTYTWTATDGVCTATGTHVLNVEANPVAGITIVAVNKCINSAQTISATGVPAGYTYSWTFGTGSTPASSTTASTSVSYTTVGIKTITLIISKTPTATAGGCANTCTWNKTTTITIGNLVGSSSCS